MPLLYSMPVVLTQLRSPLCTCVIVAYCALRQDKNKADGAAAKFQRIAKAYEVSSPGLVWLAHYPSQVPVLHENLDRTLLLPLLNTLWLHWSAHDLSDHNCALSSKLCAGRQGMELTTSPACADPQRPAFPQTIRLRDSTSGGRHSGGTVWHLEVLAHRCACSIAGCCARCVRHPVLRQESYLRAGAQPLQRHWTNSRSLSEGIKSNKFVSKLAACSL